MAGRDVNCPFCFNGLRLDQLPVVATNYTGVGDVDTGVPGAPLVPSELGGRGGDELGGRSDAPASPLPTAPPLVASQAVRPVSGTQHGDVRGGYPVLYDPLDAANYPELQFSGGLFRRRDVTILDAFAKEDMPALQCRVCELPLPPQLAGLDVITIGVVGTIRAGKSHYLTELAQELLRRQRLNQLGIGSVRGYGNVEKDLHRNQLRLVRRQKLALPRTTTEQGRQASRKPMAIQFDSATGRRAMLLFHDAPGEFFEETTKLNQHLAFMRHLDGLIILIDPLSLPAVVDKLPDVSQAHFNDADVLQHELVHRIADHVGEERLRSLPTSIAISKSDMVQRAFGPLPELDRAEASTSSQMATDIREIDRAVRDRVWPMFDEPGLDTAVERFPLRAYHLIAALGTLPDIERPVVVDGKSYAPITGDIRPSRIVDPLFNVLQSMP